MALSLWPPHSKIGGDATAGGANGNRVRDNECKRAVSVLRVNWPGGGKVSAAVKGERRRGEETAWLRQGKKVEGIKKQEQLSGFVGKLCGPG